jgi:exonuclease SbcD
LYPVKMNKKSGTYRIIHTADWHLGKTLHDQSREPEHEHFMSWLLEEIKELEADALVIAGDVFDSGLPPQKVIRHWFDFVNRLKDGTHCNLVVIGGNHDSPSQLESAGPILELLNVRVDGKIRELPKDRILFLPSGENPKVMIAMVPYLRDADLRVSVFGESSNEVQSKVEQGIRSKYQECEEAAETFDCPLIATGHLTVSGMKVSDSERKIIGGIDGVSSDLFSGKFDYVALGHLHRPQSPDGKRIHYSGSPIPLSFSEAKDKKQIRVIDVNDDGVSSFGVDIPLIRRLAQLTVSYNQMESAFVEFDPPSEKLETWVEVKVKDPTFSGNLSEEVRELAKDADYKILKVLPERSNSSNEAEENGDISGFQLDVNHPEKIFSERLQQGGIEENDQVRLMKLFEELVRIEKEEGTEL